MVEVLMSIKCNMNSASVSDFLEESESNLVNKPAISEKNGTLVLGNRRKGKAVAIGAARHSRPDEDRCGLVAGCQA